MEVIDESGEKLISTTSEREMPYMEEFWRDGFSVAFNDLETAVLDARKEASEAIVTEVVEQIGKKNR